MPRPRGSDAKALAGAAQKALAGEIDARATRLAQAADGQFVLATDGTIRWLGQPVGKLVAGEEVLKPRVRIIADEHLTGAPRDCVQARLDLWLKAHIERVLGAAVPARRRRGHHRHRARHRVPAHRGARRARARRRSPTRSRASTRPRARRCASTACASAPITSICRRCSSRRRACWRRSSGRSSTAGRRPRGSRAVEQLAASGRTSIAADKEIAKALYRTAGYRVCGERAVRVDILERLADLIRPALAWRAGAAAAKPPGAVDGFGLYRDAWHDVARRLLGRGFRLGPALARLSHGEAAEAGRVTACADGDARRIPCRRSTPMTPQQRRRTPESIADAVADPAEAPTEARGGRCADMPHAEQSEAPSAEAIATPRCLIVASATVPVTSARREPKPSISGHGERRHSPPREHVRTGERRGRPACRRRATAAAAPAARRRARGAGADRGLAAGPPRRASAPAAHRARPRPRRPHGGAADSGGSRGGCAAGRAQPAAAVAATPAPSPRRSAAPATRRAPRRRAQRRRSGAVPSARSVRGRQPAPRSSRARRAIRSGERRSDRNAATVPARRARRSSGARSGSAREIHQGARRGQGPPRPASPIRIRRSPSSRRSRSSSRRTPRSRAEPGTRTPALDRQRIDKWLWHARVVRTRSAAAALAASGHVRVNGQRVDARQPRGAGRRRGDGRARPRRARAPGAGLCRAPRFGRRGPQRCARTLCRHPADPVAPVPPPATRNRARAGRPSVSARDRRFTGEDEL